MNSNKKDEKFLIKLLIILSLLVLIIFIIFPKANFKENFAQNIRIHTCQPNFTDTNHSQVFKIKRLLSGARNYLKNKCEYDLIKIKIDSKNFKRIKKTRKKALETGILTNPKKASAKLNYNDEIFDSKIRLKGDLPNHWLINKQWSLKIELGDGKSINGMKEFSLTKLKERSFPENLIITKQYERMDIISPKFKIYKVEINGINWGLMIAEEQFSNVFLQNRQLKKGLIFKLTNEASFKINQFFKQKKIKSNKYFIRKQGKFEIDIFNKKQFSNQQNFLDQESMLKSLNEIIKSDMPIEEKSILLKRYFNTGSLAVVLANSLVFGSYHTLNLTNIRFYLNPNNLKIDPIPTDHTIDKEVYKDLDFSKYLSGLDFYKIFYEDELFLKKYIISLNQIKNDLKKIIEDSENLCLKFEHYCKERLNIQIVKNRVNLLIELDKKIFQNVNKKKKNTENNLELKWKKTSENEFKAIKVYSDYIYARLFNDYIKIYNYSLNEVKLKKLDIYFSQEKKNKCKIMKKDNCSKKTITINYILQENYADFIINKIETNLKKNQKLIWAEMHGEVRNEKFTYKIRNEKTKFDNYSFINRELN